MARRDRLRADVRAILERDPATSGAVEAALTSPGLWARWTHRLAHWLWTRGHGLAARVLSTLSRLVTGIELHPAADIGERVVIDHGQGTVVGATATVGDDVLLYHGVTLGAKEARDGERHPTLGDDVTVGANATVLGAIEVGDGATVGAGAVVVDDVAPGATVVGVPAEPVETGDEEEGEPAETETASAETCDPSETDGTDAGGTDQTDEAVATETDGAEAVEPDEPAAEEVPSCPLDDCEGPLVH